MLTWYIVNFGSKGSVWILWLPCRRHRSRCVCRSTCRGCWASPPLAEEYRTQRWKWSPRCLRKKWSPGTKLIVWNDWMKQTPSLQSHPPSIQSRSTLTGFLRHLNFFILSWLNLVFIVFWTHILVLFFLSIHPRGRQHKNWIIYYHYTDIHWLSVL